MSPGYNVGNYEPLSNLRSPATPPSPIPCPPRKRRRLQGRAGKVTKKAFFRGIKRSRTFVTGPMDPAHNKHKFFCQICKTNVSMYSKGARKIVRHFQAESQFLEDQRWRYEHLRKKDKVTILVTYENRGKNGQISTPFGLEKEKPYFESAPLVDTGCDYPFNDDYMAGPGTFINSI